MTRALPAAEPRRRGRAGRVRPADSHGTSTSASRSRDRSLSADRCAQVKPGAALAQSDVGNNGGLVPPRWSMRRTFAPKPAKISLRPGPQDARQIQDLEPGERPLGRDLAGFPVLQSVSSRQRSELIGHAAALRCARARKRGCALQRRTRPGPRRPAPVSRHASGSPRFPLGPPARRYGDVGRWCAA